MRHLFLLILFVVISGCTSQFAYRHLDWIIIWYSNDYLDLNHQQNEQFSQAVKATLRWHRQSELPKYKDQLLNIANDLQSLPLSTYQVENHGKKVHEYWINVRSHISQEITPLISQLSDDQIVYLFDRLEKNNQSRIEYLTKEPLEKRQHDQQEKWLEILSDLLGELTTVQIGLVEDFIQYRHDSGSLRIEYLQAYQAKLRQAMLADNQLDSLQALLNAPEAFKSQAYQDIQKQDKENIYRLIRDISVHLTPEQITHLQNTIQDYIVFIDEMIQS